eukprot:4323584-Pyramimonas_sp.AAC.1
MGGMAQLHARGAPSAVAGVWSRLGVCGGPAPVPARGAGLGKALCLVRPLGAAFEAATVKNT